VGHCFRRFKQLGIKGRIALEDYMVLTNSEPLTQKVELFLAGRAAHQLRDLYPAYPPERFFSEPCRPPFLRQWHNHFDNYGNLMPGYCGGISLGNWLNLDHLLKEGIDLEEYPVLKFLVSGNMQGLVDLARDLGYEESPEGYVPKCDLCLDIREHLVSRKQFKELAPRAFYEHQSAVMEPWDGPAAMAFTDGRQIAATKHKPVTVRAEKSAARVAILSQVARHLEHFQIGVGDHRKHFRERFEFAIRFTNGMKIHGNLGVLSRKPAS